MINNTSKSQSDMFLDSFSIRKYEKHVKSLTYMYIVNVHVYVFT